MLKIGIDIGSRNTKIVIYDAQTKRIEFSAFQTTEVSVTDGVNNLLKEGYTALGITRKINTIGVTGYGRNFTRKQAPFYRKLAVIQPVVYIIFSY